MTTDDHGRDLRSALSSVADAAGTHATAGDLADLRGRAAAGRRHYRSGVAVTGVVAACLVVGGALVTGLPGGDAPVLPATTSSPTPDATAGPTSDPSPAPSADGTPTVDPTLAAACGVEVATLDPVGDDSVYQYRAAGPYTTYSGQTDENGALLTGGTDLVDALDAGATFAVGAVQDGTVVAVSRAPFDAQTDGGPEAVRSIADEHAVLVACDGSGLVAPGPYAEAQLVVDGASVRRASSLDTAYSAQIRVDSAGRISVRSLTAAVDAPTRLGALPVPADQGAGPGFASPLAAFPADEQPTFVCGAPAPTPSGPEQLASLTLTSSAQELTDSRLQAFDYEIRADVDARVEVRDFLTAPAADGLLVTQDGVVVGSYPQYAGSGDAYATLEAGETFAARVDSLGLTPDEENLTCDGAPLPAGQYQVQAVVAWQVYSYSLRQTDHSWGELQELTGAEIPSGFLVSSPVTVTLG
ncbi:hypothetical protein CLV28_0754 [Sediminihabitans luteus]|uniref:Uncharacterized protein n=1 Tax=Sediminihabitans luteus TaxID=1138585 RepID=A0A2M9D0A0_9CELL|nr:hypothetical protein [Sediminihabitans luteus]PJJ77533.1 hypothetical protein CLV28_0754 [Sediminihabitans luteus]GII98432.1 hypothetical protein Slu03_08100 [Sediminihabitans luteus]